MRQEALRGQLPADDFRSRALAMNPEFVPADEPTGNRATNGVFELMRQVNHESGTTFLLATPQPRSGAALRSHYRSR
jgi:ABC-type lipoprotein export system ATPase subunit